jgi:hypothetical protein
LCILRLRWWRLPSRDRLNRGGDRQANNAIHTIAVIRAKRLPETRAYLDRRISEGKAKREAMRVSNATSPATSSNASPTSP